MADDALIRRDNLKRLMADKKLDISAMAERLKVRYSYVRDLVAEGTKKSFGERAARKIEAAFGLPRGWMDQDKAPLDAVASTPPPAPVDFEERHATDSDWAILDAVKVMMPEPELRDLMRRYEVLKGQQARYTQGLKTGTPSPAPTAAEPTPTPSSGKRRQPSPLGKQAAPKRKVA